MRKFTRKTVAVTLATAVLLSGAGAAFAYWTNIGSGSGAATTGTTTGSITVNQTTVVPGLYPGMSTPITLAGTFTNTNTGPIHVAAVTATGYTIDGAHVTAGCTVVQGNYTLGGTATVGVDVPNGTNVGSWTGLTISMNNLGTNQDACKGATLTITYASS